MTSTFDLMTSISKGVILFAMSNVHIKVHNLMLITAQVIIEKAFHKKTSMQYLTHDLMT
jgi:hypothetical protein